VIETIALPVADGSATLCAVTLTAPEGTVFGAVYTPDEDTVPLVAFPPGKPLTHQLTAVFLVPDTVAVNCRDCPTCTLLVLGRTETAIGCRCFANVTDALAEIWGDEESSALTTTALDGMVVGAV
jgi:hypothetical protein